jgi:hypothetical protein
MLLTVGTTEFWEASCKCNNPLHYIRCNWLNELLLKVLTYGLEAHYSVSWHTFEDKYGFRPSLHVQNLFSVWMYYWDSNLTFVFYTSWWIKISPQGYKSKWYQIRIIFLVLYSAIIRKTDGICYFDCYSEVKQALYELWHEEQSYNSVNFLCNVF